MRSRCWMRTCRAMLLGALLLGTGGILGAGCAEGTDAPAPRPEVAATGPSRPRMVAPEQMPAELVEPGGLHWHKTRMVVFAADDDSSDTAPPNSGPATGAGISITDMSVDEAARRFQPVMLFNGVEYEASWEDAVRIAGSAQAAARAAKGRAAGAESGIATIRQPELTSAKDDRVDVSAQAATDPYINIALMRRPHRDDIDPMQMVYDGCTCFKSNKYTCVTAAHCVSNNWRKRHPKTWKHLANIRFGSGAPSGALDEIDPVTNPYSVVIARGYWASDGDEMTDLFLTQTDFAVIRFRGPYSDPSTATGSLTPWNGPPPQITPMVPEALYNTGQPGHLTLSAYIPDIDVLRVAVVGYPGNRAPQLVYAEGTLWKPNDSRVLTYGASTSPGESGGPVLMRDSTRPTAEVVGIHHGEGPPGRNWGVQLTVDLIDWIEAVSGH
jgi:V8-like Glu-specific endopeptidase